MPTFSRRSFLATTAALPFLAWLEQFENGIVPAQAHVRYDATSTEGKAMLQTYADAVARMKDLPDTDPRSWRFQWYIHSAPRPKSNEIQRIFGAGTSPQRTLAEASWSTCQPHTAPFGPDYFLPWHRAYLLYFEQLVRVVSGNPGFTLPYWNYTAGPGRAVIPPEFTDPNSPLFVRNRSDGVNQGLPIDRLIPPARSPINLEALRNSFYNRGDRPTTTGFNPDLDGNLHAAVHGLVGDGRNMGSVSTAAQDPIFWLHHCQIDRLWYSWQRAGRRTPQMSRSFHFADPDGTSARIDLGQTLDYASQPYTYDSYADVPIPPPVLLAVQQQEVLATQARGRPVRLGTGPTQVALVPVPRPGQPGVQALSARIRSVPPERRIVLVLNGLHAERSPGVLYEVLLQVPSGATDESTTEHVAGYISFFNATAPLEEGPHHEVTYRFDVTEMTRRLADAGALEGSLRVTIRPLGSDAVEPDADATIAAVALVER
jgi:tyrosinase